MKNYKQIQLAFFESKLAEFIINNSHLLPAVNKVSMNIIHLMRNNSDEIIKQIEINAKIYNDLYGDEFFGRLDEKTKVPADIYEQIIITLLHGEDLPKIMHIHSLFVYRFFPFLTNQKIIINADDFNKPSFSLSQKLTTLFASGNETVMNQVNALTSHNHPYIQERGRLNRSEPARPSQRLGYQLPSFFSNTMSESISHIPGEQRFTLDESSYAHLVKQSDDIVFVAGISAHTFSFLKGILLYGNLDQEETKQYALAIFAYLGGGGNHSFHEVMSVLHVVADMEFKIGEYKPSLPVSVLKSDEFNQDENNFGFARRFSFQLERKPEKGTQRIWANYFKDKKPLEKVTSENSIGKNSIR